MTLLVHLVIIKGASCVILRKFELEKFCRAIQDYKVNIAPIVPPIISLLVNNPIARKYDLSSLKLAISAAAPLSKVLCKKFVEIYKALIKQAYGLTETTPFAIVTKTDNIVDGKLSCHVTFFVGSIGILIPNVECKVISEDNKELILESRSVSASTLHAGSVSASTSLDQHRLRLFDLDHQLEHSVMPPRRWTELPHTMDWELHTRFVKNKCIYFHVKIGNSKVTWMRKD